MLGATRCKQLAVCMCVFMCVYPDVNKKAKVIMIYYNFQQLQQQSIGLIVFFYLVNTSSQTIKQVVNKVPNGQTMEHFLTGHKKLILKLE